ncbi:LysR family transcriptional regulator [Bordetella genomosp. 13]|uniref:LysR family transcriptional regulator n=1 Tax=Bordetella genomosp. 13 TaxID=463040 RepID=UPI0016434A24|nr:LysR family transcriptional regulator [Bordetella genomosp. 13]
MQHLDLTALRCFSEAAESGSIRLASARLHVTPSAVSRQIAKLEHRLGAVLFERRANGVVLTPSGRLLADELSSVYRNLSRVQSMIGELRELRRGEVVLHCMEGAVDSWVPAVVAAFNARHPKIEFKLAVSSTDLSIEALLAGKCDMAIVFRAPARPEIEVLESGTEPLAALVPPGHALAARAAVRIEELFQYPLVLPDATFGLRQLLEPLLRRHKDDAPVLVTTNSIAMTRSMVRQGVGITVLPYLSAAHDCELGLLKAVPLADAGYVGAQVDLCVRRDREPTVAAREMLALMRPRFTSLFAVRQHALRTAS